jgi:hypothetical protein
MNYSFILTSGTTFKLPIDVNLIQVECFGPSCSLATNLGGSYSKSYKVKVTPGSTLYYNIGTVNSGNTWVNTVSFSQPSSGSGSNTNNSCLATGGSFYTSQTSQVNDCIGDIVNPGGLNTSQNFGGGVAYSAGGQAGPNGKGGNATYSSLGYGAGGGANGGGDATNLGSPPYVQQGAGRLGSLTSGGSGGISSSTTGTKDLLYTDSLGNINGPQGGGAAFQGCCNGTTTYNLTDPNGFIVITIINPKLATTLPSTYIERYTVGGGAIRVPAGTTNILIEGIGAGSQGGYSLTTFGTNYTAGGGGGGYANTNISTSVKDFTKGGFIFYNVPAGGSYISVNSNTWVNITTNVQPATASEGIVAMSAYSNIGGGANLAITGLSPNIGGNTAIGGNGGQGRTVTSTSVNKGGGGGGAAYIYAGGTGGTAFNPTSSTAYPGGGGGSAATLSGAGQTGGTATATVGGRGANTAVATGTGGAGGTTTAIAGSGTNGGGGGGSALTSSYQPAGAGSKYNVASWYDSSTSTVYGPGGGGGGGGSSSTVNGYGGSGAIGYGGGGGGGDVAGVGGPGLIVLTYTFDTTLAAAFTSNQENCYGYIIG